MCVARLDLISYPRNLDDRMVIRTLNSADIAGRRGQKDLKTQISADLQDDGPRQLRTYLWLWDLVKAAGGQLRSRNEVEFNQDNGGFKLTVQGEVALGTDMDGPMLRWYLDQARKRERRKMEALRPKHKRVKKGKTKLPR